MIRTGFGFSGGGNRTAILLATDMSGKYRTPARIRPKKYRMPSPMAMRLMEMLSVSNYVRPDALYPRDTSRAVQLLKSAKMVCYSMTSNVWVPDVGTYDWLVKQRERMTNAR